MERATGLEPATPSLVNSRATSALGMHHKSLRWLIASPKTAFAVLAKRLTRSQLDGGFCVFLPALDAINMFDRRHVPRTFGTYSAHNSLYIHLG